MNNANLSNRSRQFSLGLYLLIVFGLSWPFQIASTIWATDLWSRFLLNSISMVMVSVGTFIAGRYVFRDGFGNAGWQWGKLKHYLAVFGFVALLWVFPTLIRLMAGALDPDDLDRTKLVWIFLLPLVALIPGFGEEFGWRGYMLPHLANRLSVRKAVALHSLIWWVWHLPITIGTGVQAGVEGAAQTNLPVALSVTITVLAVIIVGAIPTIMHGVVFAYIWTQSGSLAVATVYHAVYDGIRDSLAMVTGLPPIVATWASALLTILGIALLWKGNWKRLEEQSISN